MPLAVPMVPMAAANGRCQWCQWPCQWRHLTIPPSPDGSAPSLAAAFLTDDSEYSNKNPLLLLLNPFARSPSLVVRVEPCPSPRALTVINKI